MAWQQPKTNWDTHPKAIEPADLNRIEGNIEVVRGKSDLPLRLEVVDSFPSHAPGRAIYHTGNKMAYVSDGNNWMTFASPQFTKTYTPGTTDQTIDEGYHKNSVVKGDANLIAANIVAGKSIFGVVGRAKRSRTGGFSIKDETKSIEIGFKARCVLCLLDDYYWAMAGLFQSELKSASTFNSFRITEIGDSYFTIRSTYENRYYGTYWAFEY
jgi:hypothetical protein